MTFPTKFVLSFLAWGALLPSSTLAIDKPQRLLYSNVNRESTTAVQPPQTSDRIAIIGGGVHGLFTARALKQGGYTNVVVFEKEEALAAITESFNEDGKTFDYSTKFIPADTVFDAGPPPELAAMIAAYGLTIRPYTAPLKTYMYPSGTVLDLPAPLIPYATDPGALIGNLTAGYELLLATASVAKTPMGIIEAGVVSKSETWADFATRIKLPAFTDFCEFLTDIFIGGPLASQSAAIGLSVRLVYTPSYLKTILLAFGIDKNTQLPIISPTFRNLLGGAFPGASYVIDEGYQRFFDVMVDQEGINVCLGCKVKKIKVKKKRVRKGKRGGGITVFADSENSHERKQTFDHVIISSRPDDTLGYLQGKSALERLVRDASGSDPVFTMAYHAASTFPALDDTFAAVVYPPANSFPQDDTVFAVAKDFADSNVCVCLGYADPDSTEDEAIAKATADLAAYSLPVDAVIGYRRYDYVSYPSAEVVADDWFAKIDDIQGMDGIYVIGEALSGYGVPTALNFVNTFYDKYFDPH